MAKKGIISKAGDTISGAASGAASVATDMAAGAALTATGAARRAVRGVRRMLAEGIEEEGCPWPAQGAGGGPPDAEGGVIDPAKRRGAHARAAQVGSQDGAEGCAGDGRSPQKALEADPLRSAAARHHWLRVLHGFCTEHC
jgi:hypothetical protein